MNLKKLHLLLITSVALLISIFFSSCAPEYIITVDCSDGGSVTFDPDETSFTENEIVNLTATSESDYYFTSWGDISEYSSDSASSNEISITMPEGDIEISANFSKKDEGWTFLIYLAGDNSLSSYVNDDINEIEQGLYDALENGNSGVLEDAVVLVLADYETRFDDTVLYLMTPDDNSWVISSSEISDDAFSTDEDLNMGDPDTLSAFIEYGLEEYPSLYNALILWNHGGGSKSIGFEDVSSRNICSDDTSDDILYNDEVQQAIADGLAAASVDEFDIIGFDACLMGTVETAYELRNLATYYTGSAASEWGSGWDYQEIFGEFSTEDDVPLPLEMADIFVTQYKESTDTESSYDNTMVTIELSKMETLKTQIDDLAAELYVDGDSSLFETQRDNSAYYYDSYPAYYYPYTDLYSFCSGVSVSDDFTAEAQAAADDVLEALDNAVVACYAEADIDNFEDYYYTDDANADRGLSIFISHGDETVTDAEDVTQSWYGYYQWWYYDAEVTSSTGVALGNLDFCTSDTDGSVETWRELFEAWYDSDCDYTPGSY